MSSNFLVLPTTLFFSWASPFSGVLLTLVLPSLASRILIGFVFLWVLDCGIFGSVSVLFSSLCRPLFRIWSWRICRPLIFVVHCPFCFSVYNLWLFGLAQPLLLSVVYSWCSLSMSFLNVHFVLFVATPHFCVWLILAWCRLPSCGPSRLTLVPGDLGDFFIFISGFGVISCLHTLPCFMSARTLRGLFLY